MKPHKRPGHAHAIKDYDLELEVLAAVRPDPRVTFTTCEIAEVCGVSRQAIRYIERRALRKLRPLLETHRAEVLRAPLFAASFPT